MAVKLGFGGSIDNAKAHLHFSTVGNDMDQAQESISAVENRQSLTEQLARYWSGARYEDLPDDVVAMAKSVLLDTLSVGVRGAESEVAVATRTGIASALECSSGSASLWGTRLSLPPSAAALV